MSACHAPFDTYGRWPFSLKPRLSSHIGQARILRIARRNLVHELLSRKFARLGWVEHQPHAHSQSALHPLQLCDNATLIRCSYNAVCSFLDQHERAVTKPLHRVGASRAE